MGVILMNSRKFTRLDVLEFISKQLGVPVDRLNDETPLGGECEEISILACFSFDKVINIYDPKNFTVGQLIVQIVEK